MTYNGRANEALEHALKKAHEKCAGSLGRYISFDIQNSGIRKVTLEELLEYCNKWYDKEIDKFEDAWKPEIGPHKDSGGRGWQPDRSGIQLLSGHYCGVWGVKVHGRMESVRAMAVIAAGFSLNIPPEIAMVCPAAAEWWDWLEKLGLVRDRPPATRVVQVVEEKGGSIKYRAKYDDKDAKTSQAVKNYMEPMRSDRNASAVELARRNLETCRPNWAHMEGEEAMVKYRAAYGRISASYRGEYYIRAELDHGLTITNGNVVWYCMQIWPDAVIDKLGTRWRPRSNAVARGKTHDHKTQGEKGGVYVADEGHNAVACIGSPMLCRAVMPILAAMAAGIPDAKMVASCAPEFDIFWEYVGWNKHMPPPEAPPGKSDGTGRWRNSRAYDQENNEDDTFMATLFMQENDALLEQLWCSVGEYNRTAGHWTGGNCNPGVSWSRDDFVDQLMLWWPFALIEEVGRFRYRPEFMDKGGVYLDLGGYYTCVQTKEAWAQAMMCMLSSIMCGIPSEIAALLPACDPFWDLVVDIKGPEAVRAQREAIRDARDSRFGEAWQRQRFFKLYGSTCEFRPSLPRSRQLVGTHGSPSNESKPKKAGFDKKAPASARSSSPTTTSEHGDIRPCKEVVFAAIDYFHDQRDVARMKRGEKFYCQYETPDLYLGSKPGDGRQVWLPKFVVTGNLCGVRGG